MFKPKYFLYARKSTEDDDRQVMSIEAQLFELREFARKENLEILEEFQESKSAKIPGRLIFNEMIDKIDQMEGVGVLAWHPDRLARSSMDGEKVIYLVDQKKIVSLRFPTFWFEPTPQGLFMLQVAFGQSKYYSDNLQESIRRGMRQKLRRGEWLVKAPLGYVNNPRTRNIEPHPVVSRVVVKAFEEYVKGTHGVVSLAKFMAHHGVTTKKGTPLGKASVTRMLTNRVYIGLVAHKGEWFPGSFEPIISPKLFEAVQKIVTARKRAPKRKEKHDFPFAGFFECGECGSTFTAQWATGKSGGRYRCYRCTKKRGTCSQKYVREDILAAQIREQLLTISLCDEMTDRILKQVDAWEKEDTASSQSSVLHLAERIKASEARLEKLVESYLYGDIPKDLYVKKKDEIMRAALTLEEKLKDAKHSGNNWVEPLREWILDTKQANFLSNSDDLHKQKELVQKIGTNPFVRDKSARFGVPVPSEMVRAYRTKTDFGHPLLPQAKVVRMRELSDVSLCGDGGYRSQLTNHFAPSFCKMLSGRDPASQPHSATLRGDPLLRPSIPAISYQNATKPKRKLWFWHLVEMAGIEPASNENSEPCSTDVDRLKV